MSMFKSVGLLASWVLWYTGSRLVWAAIISDEVTPVRRQAIIGMRRLVGAFDVAMRFDSGKLSAQNGRMPLFVWGHKVMLLILDQNGLCIIIIIVGVCTCAFLFWMRAAPTIIKKLVLLIKIN